MIGFVVLAWQPGNERAGSTARSLNAGVSGEKGAAYRVQASTPGLLIVTRDLPVRSYGPTSHLIGTAFARQGASTGPGELTSEATFQTWCERLLASHWGSYLAVHQTLEGAATLSVFADPIGMRESFTWMHKDVRIVTSDPDTWLVHAGPRELGLDIDELAHLVAHPSQVAEVCPLAGITPILPGTLTCFDEAGTVRRTRLWQPRAFCRTAAMPPDRRALAALVDHCVAAWHDPAEPALIELSGGLDSSLVAASLTRSRKAHDRLGGGGCVADLTGFSFFTSDLAGDERRYSRQVAARLGLANQEVALVPVALDARSLDGVPAGIRPGIGSTTIFHDRSLAEHGQALQARTLFTGRGGDALFFQHPAPAIAREPWPTGMSGKVSRIESLARWCQTTVWTIAAHALAPALRTSPGSRPANRFARGAFAPRASYWAGALEGLTAVKRMQIAAMAGDRAAFGPSCCGRTMRVVHPLLSQPLVEWALGQSILVLTDGRRDRALARAAFAGRLPASVITRRGKGATSTFFGRTLAASIPFLRDWLLGGALSDLHLIESAALARALDRDALMQADCYNEILALVLIEHWLREWRSRLAHGSGPGS